MRVLMLSWEYPPRSIGGLARHVEDLALSLAEDGHHLTIVTCAAQGAPQRESRDGLTICRVQPYPPNTPDFVTWILQLNLAMLEQAISIFQEPGSFEVIHAHDWLVAFTARALKHAYQLPLISTIHATEAGRNHGLHNDLQRYIGSAEWWLTYESWRVIVCSEHMRSEVQALFQLPADKVAVIPNGVWPHRFKHSDQDPRFRDRYAKQWEKIVFYVGRLVQEKGVQVLLDAMPVVLSSCPEAKLVIAGTGPMEGELRHKASNMGLRDKVCFAGRIDDWTRNQLYQQAAVAVVPSLYEPFGIVALEAMAAGTPVVVTDTGGLGEIVVHDVNGLKALTGNAVSLASQVTTLLRDPALGDNLRRNAFNTIKEVYDWHRIADQTASIYSKVFSEYLRSPWQPGRTTFQRFRRALGFSGNRGSSGMDAPVAQQNYHLIEQRVHSVNHHHEGREIP